MNRRTLKVLKKPHFRSSSVRTNAEVAPEDDTEWEIAWPLLNGAAPDKPAG